MTTNQAQHETHAVTSPAQQAAEPTLQIVAFLQSDPTAPQSIERWHFVPAARPWPGGPEFTTAEAATYLAAIDKPIIIGALDHPGQVAVWRLTSLDPADLEYLKRLLNNQLGALADSLTQIGADDDGIVLFEGLGSQTRVPVPVLREWLGDYGLTWGWRLGAATDDTHGLRMFIRQGPGWWSPGDNCRPP